MKELSIISRSKISLDNQILRTVRFLAPAQAATISPPIGPILGQFGINIMDFCKQFNEQSKFIESDTLVIVFLTLYKNKSFSFAIKTPPFSFLVNEENIEIEENSIPIFLNLSTLYKILKIKNYGQNIDEVSLFRSLCGSLRSMHIQLCNDIS
jgi:large subunit ribosomal protein L11